MEDDIKSIKLGLPYCDEDGRVELKDQTVYFKKAIVQDSSSFIGSGLTGKLIYYTMNVSIKIPEHIHAKLKGQEVPLNNMNNEIRSYADFSKTLTSSSIEGLTKRYREIIIDYRWLVNIEKAFLKKVIFYRLSGSTGGSSSSYNSIQLGRYANLKYNYAIGFVAKDNQRFNENKKPIRSGEDVNAWAFVEYTEAREKFFYDISETFEKVIGDFKKFTSSMSEESIDKMIDNDIKLLS